MNKSESKYFHTALRMNEALISLLEKKDLEFITVKEIAKRPGSTAPPSTCITKPFQT